MEIVKDDLSFGELNLVKEGEEATWDQVKEKEPVKIERIGSWTRIFHKVAQECLHLHLRLAWNSPTSLETEKCDTNKENLKKKAVP